MCFVHIVIAQGKTRLGANDNDNDNDTLREVPHLSMRAWPYRQERRGHGPTKRICLTGKTCSVGKVQKSLCYGQSVLHSSELDVHG